MTKKSCWQVLYWFWATSNLLPWKSWFFDEHVTSTLLILYCVIQNQARLFNGTSTPFHPNLYVNRTRQDVQRWCWTSEMYDFHQNRRILKSDYVAQSFMIFIFHQHPSCPRFGKKCSKFIKIWCAEAPALCGSNKPTFVIFEQKLTIFMSSTWHVKWCDFRRCFDYLTYHTNQIYWKIYVLISCSSTRS